MEAYLRILWEVLENGVLTANRTDTKTKRIVGAMFEHDMSEGFPLLTTKKMPQKTIMVELEGFINGITDKQWYQERGCRIWDDWCTPVKVPYGHDPDTKRRMREEHDLGPIYGFQWRHFGANYRGPHADYSGKGLWNRVLQLAGVETKGEDQLERLVRTLKEDPYSRRNIVDSWNPQDEDKMALPPCHYSYQVTVMDDKINLFWSQRSVDVMLGLPFNIAGYGLLLHLLAKETGLQEGKLVGFLADVHIYENHLKKAEEQLVRFPYSLPTVETSPFTSIFQWKHTDTIFVNYKSHPAIKMEVAV